MISTCRLNRAPRIKAIVPSNKSTIMVLFFAGLSATIMTPPSNKSYTDSPAIIAQKFFVEQRILLLNNDSSKVAGVVHPGTNKVNKECSQR